MGIWEELRREECWNRLPETGGEFFDACFDMEAETIPAGALRQSRGRVGYLISGRAQLRTEDDLIHAGEGTLFGAVQPGTAETRRPQETELWAVTECQVLWLDGAVLRNVCYAACWFHARFIWEAEAYFKAHRG